MRGLLNSQIISSTSFSYHHASHMSKSLYKMTQVSRLEQHNEMRIEETIYNQCNEHGSNTFSPEGVAEIIKGKKFPSPNREGKKKSI